MNLAEWDECIIPLKGRCFGCLLFFSLGYNFKTFAASVNSQRQKRPPKSPGAGVMMSSTDLQARRYRNLDADKIVATATLLCQRIRERFPGRGLNNVCADVQKAAEETRQRAAWISRPHWAIRLAIALVVGLLLLIMGRLLLVIHLDVRQIQALGLADFLQTLEAAINDVILIGAALFFFFTVESRLKRRRALEALHELRSLAHVIDMHQLTKDPQRALKRGKSTASSPVEDMTLFELSRYLDYCSEMLSLIGKIAALYLQEFDDPVALGAVDEIESLTTNLSRKIWQKIMIVHALLESAPGEPPSRNEGGAQVGK